MGTLRQLKAGWPGGGSAHRGSLASQQGPEASLGVSPQDGWGPPGLAAARAHSDQRARAGGSRPQKSPATPHRASPSSLEPTAKGVSQASGSKRYQGAWEWTFNLSNRPPCLGPQKEDGVKRPGRVPGPSPAGRSHSRGGSSGTRLAHALGSRPVPGALGRLLHPRTMSRFAPTSSSQSKKSRCKNNCSGGTERLCPTKLDGKGPLLPETDAGPGAH